jgi:2-amino-4-hydroxy-6-hydroxymethyldihydropteridine diphosphokinase
MTRGFIGLGSNLGDKRGHIANALAALGRAPGIEVRRVAGIYRTAPMGPVNQDWYLNTVAEIATMLTPPELLARCQGIEESLGRVRRERWDPRTIDLDLLWLDDCTMSAEGLTLPHPGAHLRSFVLVPLCELAPDLKLHGETLEHWRARADPLGIEVDA